MNIYIYYYLDSFLKTKNSESTDSLIRKYIYEIFNFLFLLITAITENLSSSLKPPQTP